jgi:hypothetical protein
MPAPLLGALGRPYRSLFALAFQIMKKRRCFLWLMLLLVAGAVPGCATSRQGSSAAEPFAKHEDDDAEKYGMIGFFEEFLYNSFKGLGR